MLENRCFWWRDVISATMATLPILRVNDFSMRNWSILPKWGNWNSIILPSSGVSPPPSLLYYRYIHIISSWSTRKTLSQDTAAVSASSGSSIDLPLGTHKRNMRHVSPPQADKRFIPGRWEEIQQPRNQISFILRAHWTFSQDVCNRSTISFSPCSALWGVHLSGVLQDSRQTGQSGFNRSSNMCHTSSSPWAHPCPILTQSGPQRLCVRAGFV